MAARKYIYFGEIYRFGYTLHCIDTSEEKVRNALIEEYVKTYKKCNDGADPKSEYELKESGSDEYNSDDAEYYEAFLDDLCIQKRKLGEVEWT